MAGDYIPSKDVLLLPFAANFLSTISGNEASFGLALLDSTTLATAITDFETKFTTVSAGVITLKQQTALKDSSRGELQHLIRVLARQVQANPNVTDAQRADLSITVPDRVPTTINAPLSHPNLSVDFSMRRMHKISAVDSASPNSKAKPAGTVGFSLWLKITADQPADISTMEYIGLVTSASQMLNFEESNIGQTAWYCACWQTASGKRSPFGGFYSATIAK